VPLGNVYYYFKTKDDVARAVIDERLNGLRELYTNLQTLPDPKERLYALLSKLEKTRSQVAAYGCPIGGLCIELNKDNPEIAPFADKILTEMLAWVTAQFAALGCDNSDEFGARFIVTLQGASVLANALHKPKVISQQFSQLRQWIEEIS
jgi:AcrR family transcriptional regulator